MGKSNVRLCTICARAGSKGVPNKNIRLLAGTPLIAHSIMQAKTTKLFSHIAVSSDSQAILDVAHEYGADQCVMRPAELAGDRAPKMKALQHLVRAVMKMKSETFETIVDLDPSAPLRGLEDIRSCVVLFETRGVSNVITGVRSRKSPYFNLVEINKKGVVHLSKKQNQTCSRRQDSPACFDMNASIYVWKPDALLRNDQLFREDTLLFEMPKERSLDIDTELDFEMVEFVAKKTGILCQKLDTKSSLV